MTSARKYGILHSMKKPLSSAKKRANSAWNKRNPESLRASKAAFYARNSEKIRAQKAAEYSLNPEKFRALARAQRLRNPGKQYEYRYGAAPPYPPPANCEVCGRAFTDANKPWFYQCKLPGDRKSV